MRGEFAGLFKLIGIFITSMDSRKSRANQFGDECFLAVDQNCHLCYAEYIDL